MTRAWPRHTLQARTFGPGASIQVLEQGHTVFFSGGPNLAVDLQTEAVQGAFKKGLQDAESVEVSLNHIFALFL
jgi:hypothetical protein